VLALKGRDYDAARARFDEALSYDPYLRQAWAAQSELHLRQKRYREAAEAAEKAIALGFKDEAVLRVRWDAYRGLGDEAKAAAAREELEGAGRLGEEAKRIHNEAVALSKAGDDAGALAKFKEALAVDPAFAPSLLGLATAALKAGQAAEAATAAEKLLEADARNEPALRLRYNAALKLGNDAVVVDALVGLAAVDKAFARDSLFKLGQAAFDADRAADARDRLGKVLEIEPDHPRSHYLLGLIHMREGRTKEAKAHLERFVALAPADPDAATARSALAQLKP
jgi:Tfp pilus assembly protein PilF